MSKIEVERMYHRLAKGRIIIICAFPYERETIKRIETNNMKRLQRRNVYVKFYTAKAFDKVWHTGLLFKLKNVLPLPTSYSLNRIEKISTL